MPKYVVYTCITKGYDNIIKHSYKHPGWDYVCFTDNPDIKSDFWEIRPLQFNKSDQVRNARWHKTNPHLLFPEHEASLWVDGNIDIISDGLFDLFLNSGKNLLTVKHLERDCIYDECTACIKYGKDKVSIINKTQKMLSRHHMPRNYGLCETNLIFRKHNDILIKKIDEDWWKNIEKYSRRDQLSFTYVLFKNSIKVDDISFPNERKNPKNYKFNPAHSGDKRKKFAILRKERLPNGRRHIYLFGIKLISYKKKSGSQISILSATPLELLRRYSAPDGFQQMLVDEFYKKTGILPNEPLTTMNQKITWSMMFNVTDAKKQYADKLLVREYIAKKIGDKYLTKVYGSWNNPSAINFTFLPKKFVLKCNNGSGMNMVVKDKSKLNEAQTISKAREWLNIEFALQAMEMNYYAMPKFVFAEEFLDLTELEYKFWCFGGKVKFVQILSYKHGHTKIGTKWFGPDWTPLDFYTSEYEIPDNIPRPKQLDNLIKLSEKLTADFDFVRCDWYLLKNGEIKFSELTFSPTAGQIPFHPASADSMMGLLWDIPERTPDGFIKKA